MLLEATAGRLRFTVTKMDGAYHDTPRREPVETVQKEECGLREKKAGRVENEASSGDYSDFLSSTFRNLS